MLCTTMRNGDNAQQTGFQPTAFQQFSAETPSAAGESFFVMDSQADGSSQKRGRGGEGNASTLYHLQQGIQHGTQSLQPYQAQTPPVSVATPVAQEAPLPEKSFKRSRSSNYQAPRAVKPSILTAMGSLAGGSLSSGGGSSGSSGRHGSDSSFVPFRRQLSGGALEQYIGGHDTMETDIGDSTRPRSMSF